MIKIRNLSKKYGKSDVFALKDINFEVSEGEVVGLIGRNGAGKSTLLKLLGKFIKPTEGNILFGDKSIFETDYVLKKAGILYEPLFFNHLTALDNLRYYVGIHQMAVNDDEIIEMLDMLGLSGKENVKPREFSFGMQQRLGLAQALLGKPEMLFLDEPFVGLDPPGVSELIQIISRWAKDKKMEIIVSSHQLYELSELCKRVIVLQSGKLVYDGAMNSTPEITLTLDRDYCGDIDGLYDVNSNSNRIQVCIEESDYGEFLSEVQKNYTIIDIEKSKSKLERFFRE